MSRLLRSLGFGLGALALAVAPASAGAWQTESWHAYVAKFVQTDGRVIDFAVPPGITTSEGQAYAMLRALWSDDRPVFERVWRWTEHNLSRPGSPLPAWKWGALPKGGWGVLDANTASDADVLLALALCQGARRWNVPAWEERGRAIATAAWEDEVVQLGGRWFLLPGQWAKTYDPIPLNLSYYSPALLRRLVSCDPTHPWQEVAETTYFLLATRLPVGALPPDWMSIDPNSLEVKLGGIDGALRAQFGHDAYRVYFNLALDYVWDRKDEAKRYLVEQRWLAEFLALNGTLPREVSPNGIPRLTGPEPLALFGSLYPGYMLFDRPSAERLRTLLDAAYRDGLWGARADYYEQNLVWFGQALAEGFIKPFEGR